MKKHLFFPMLLIAMGIGINSSAQRYLTEIFTSGQIETTNNTTYATNIDWLFSNFSDPAAVQSDMMTIGAALQGGNPIPAEYYNPASSTAIKVVDLRMDIRKPMASEDPLAARPAIIYVHTGNFLPPIVNGGITGSKIDSAGVNLAKQWAKRGFVGVNVEYRRGWNPVSTDPDVRRGTLLNAVYRAIHDVKMAVRYLKANAAELGIDPDQIILYGQGSGGYVVNAYATLDDIAELFLPKFIDSNTGTSYVNVDIVGGIDGYGGGLNLYQDVGISADVAFTVNAGGALGDESWMDGGEPPHVAFHCIRDPFAPFDEGTVIVPTTNEDVVDVHGSNFFVQKAVDLGNNDVFVDFPSDPYTDRARSLYGETFAYIYPAPNNTITVNATPEGLFPFLKPISDLNVFLNESGPWDWWNFETLQQVVAGYNAATGANVNATELHQQGVAGNPGMGPEKGLAHIDTIQGYMVPRIVAALDLATGINEAPEAKVNLEIFPNPSSDFVSIYAEGEMIDHIELFDLTGKRVKVEQVNNDRFIMQRGGLENGMYILNLWFDGKRASSKVIFK
jgi:hypothetical protein